MRIHRTLARRFRATVLSAAGAILASAAPAAAAIYSLHIGIDDYRYVTPLEGAAADARSFEAMFRSAGAETTLLLDGGATRERIISAFNAMAERAEPGDTIVLTYAGHGAQMPERLEGDEADGRDEFFVLPLYGRDQGSPWNDMLIDNDIAKLFRSVHPDVAIVFIADSCHSGTMTRSVDPRGAIGKSRQITPAPETLARLLPTDLPDLETRGAEAETLPNVIFVAASQEYELANETRETGTPRGALSVAIEEALATEGAGIGTVGELEQLRAHVLNRVRGMVGERQNPFVAYDRDYVLRVLQPRGVAIASAAPLTRGLDRMPGGASAEELRSRVAQAPPPPAPTALAATFDASTARVYVEGPGADEMRRALGAFGAPAASRGAADIVWDLARSEMVDVATADMIGVAANLSAAERVTTKWRAVEALTDALASRSLTVRIAPEDPSRAADDRFRDGDLVNIEVEWPLRDRAPYPFVTIVNLANGGEVQYVFPFDMNPRVFGAENRVERIGPFPVKAPYGADHVVVLASEAPLTDLWRELDALHERPAVEAFVALLDRYAGGADVRIGITGLYTGD